MQQLFFELIRLALGTQDSLSHTPDEKDCDSMFRMAKKHSVLGVCFVGAQKLCDSRSKFYGGMPRPQYVKLLGAATKIVQSNRVLDSRCVELQSILEQNGFAAIILKGQAIASYYAACNPAFFSVAASWRYRCLGVTCR